MKGRRRSFIFGICGLAVILLALFAGVFYVRNTRGADSSQALDFASMTPIQQQAWQLASQVVGNSKSAQEQFVNQLLDVYDKAKNCDVLILCAPGGWGKIPMESDKQAQTWLAGMESTLTKMGYNYCQVDDIRTEKGLWGYVVELKEQLSHYPYKAKETAAEIDFLTRNISGLKVIITGQSNGAGLAGEVIGRLQDNPEVFSIEVGIPFWHRVIKTSRSLIIDTNGMGPDALTERDIMTLLKANWLRIFILNEVPAFTPFDWLVSRAILIFGPYKLGIELQAPGHDYKWSYPGVGPQIQEFLLQNLNTK
jgi:hypothetical protein